MSMHLHLDPVGGIAGNMLCAALIELGADLASIQAGLDAIGILDVKVSTSKVKRGVFAATHFDVSCPPTRHPHRSHSTIVDMIAESALSTGVKSRVSNVFLAIATAEAKVHGTAIADVHFHEVGAWDSIADIVGVAVALEQLDVSTITANPPPLSSGSIKTQHGAMPLPAPATLALLEGWPVRPGPEGRESTTPTGAGILAALARPGPMPTMRLLATGVGAGSRNPDDVPNILRATLGEIMTTSQVDQVTVLEAQMDDFSGEHLPPLISAVLEAGALDVYASPVLMKKGRSGMLITALSKADHAEAVTTAMLKHGSTFGVRKSQADRTVLDRWHTPVDTPFGSVRVKVGALNGEVLQASPEFEDVAAVAISTGQPAPIIHAAAIQAWRNTHGDK
jgi:uncharacterized protein (TIGR00299 family) protein